MNMLIVYRVTPTRYSDPYEKEQVNTELLIKSSDLLYNILTILVNNNELDTPTRPGKFYVPYVKMYTLLGNITIHLEELKQFHPTEAILTIDTLQTVSNLLKKILNTLGSNCDTYLIFDYVGECLGPEVEEEGPFKGLLIDPKITDKQVLPHYVHYCTYLVDTLRMHIEYEKGEEI